VQSTAAPPSSEQAKVAPVSSAAKAKLGLASVDGSAGLPLSVTVGAVVSIVHAAVAARPVLPARSVARTAKVCAPSARPV
jgi:hypothetical protein